MAITFTKSRLVLILVIFFTILVAGVAVGTAVLLSRNGIGGDKSLAATECIDAWRTNTNAATNPHPECISACHFTVNAKCGSVVCPDNTTQYSGNYKCYTDGTDKCAPDANACVGHGGTSGGTGDGWPTGAKCRTQVAGNACSTSNFTGCNPSNPYDMCWCDGPVISTVGGWTYHSSFSFKSIPAAGALCGVSRSACNGVTGVTNAGTTCGNPYLCPNTNTTPVPNIPCFTCTGTNGSCAPSGTYLSNPITQNCPSGQDKDSACTNLNKCQAATPTPTPTPSTQTYKFLVNAFCDNTQIVVPFSYSGTRSGNGNTPGSSATDLPMGSYNITCGNYTFNGQVKSPTIGSTTYTMPANNGSQFTCHYTGCTTPTSTPTTTRTTQNTNTPVPTKTPIPTTSIAPPPSSYTWNIKSYCDSKEVSGAVFSYTGTKGSTATNQTTPRSNLSAVTGETVNVVCGGYADSITGTTKTPTTANQTVTSTNTSISCNYTGCSLPPTTTPPPTTMPPGATTTIPPTTTVPPTTTPPPPPVTYYCDNTRASVTRNGTLTYLNRGDRVDTGEVVNFSITGSSTATGGTGYTLTSTGGASASGSSANNPGSFNYTIPSTGTDLSLIGYAKQPNGVKLYSSLCNFNLVMNRVKGEESYVVSKVANPSTILPGDTTNITLKVTNNGTVDTTIKEITDLMPNGFTYAGSPSMINPDESTGTITETTSGNKSIFTINNGNGVLVSVNKSFTITFTMKAPTGTQCFTYTNVVTVTSPSGPSGQTDITVCSPTGKPGVLPDTGVFDTLIVSMLIGGGMVAVSYASYRYDLAKKLNLLFKRRK